MSKSWPTYATCKGTYNDCSVKEQTVTKRNTDSIECTYKSNIYNVCSKRFTVKKMWGLEEAKSRGMVNMVCKCTNNGSNMTSMSSDYKCTYADASTTDATPGATTSKVNGLDCVL